MRNQLKKMYEGNVLRFKIIKNQFPEDDLYGPFLMSPGELYSKQKNRLLIIGQQTNGWSYEPDNIEKQMKHYEEFNVGEKYYASPFWNITRKTENAIGNVDYSCAWANFNKFDLEEGRPYGEYEKAIAELDNVLLEEIKILKPNVCIFFTGPSFDFRIRRLFENIEFITINGWTIRQFCQLKHPNLPDKTFRTYHSKYLRMKYFEDDFIEFMEKVK